MSWMSELIKTYDNSKRLWDNSPEENTDGMIPLLRMGQSTQNAQIEVILSQNENSQNVDLLSAYFIKDKKSQVTVIPCTEISIGRVGSQLAPHPLHDKLQYVAGDYRQYGGDKNSGFNLYLEQLTAWCDSDFCHPKVKAVRDYLKKGTLIADLIKSGIKSNEMNELINTNAFIRFRVDIKGDGDNKLWFDQSVTDCFISWQRSLNRDKGLCYVTGQNETLSKSHPSKIRHTGDKAKLISTNDSSGFTYRGRFLKDNQAVGVGYDASQKAHNMLKYLISRRGYRNDSQVFVAWGTKLQALPRLEDDGAEIFGTNAESAVAHPEEIVQNLRMEYAARLKNTMKGYAQNIGDGDSVVVMGLDSATTGRLSIIFYREITGSDFLEKISQWHTSCTWLHSYKFIEKKRVIFYGAPSPEDIALAAYGKNIPDKLKKAIIEKLLRCIVDAKPIPPGIRQSLVRRASNPVAMEEWEWNKTMSIACAVVRKHLIETKGGTWDMALDNLTTDRSYLFGRLLAYAQSIENYAQWATEKAHRQTNAERMMHQLSLRPAKTWQQLYLKLQSYMRQLKKPALVNKWNTGIYEIIDKLGQENFTNAPLDEQYLLGFSSQILELRKKNEKEDEENTDNDNA